MRSAPFPPEWRKIIETHCLFCFQLPAQDRRELEGHIQVFIAEKKFEGCGEMTLSRNDVIEKERPMGN